MVSFGTHYMIDEADVSLIEIGRTTGDHPFYISATLKNGREIKLFYQTEPSRDMAYKQFARAISLERRADIEKINNRLWYIDDTLKRLERRQKRIWKILKNLLALKGPCAEGDDLE